MKIYFENKSPSVKLYNGNCFFIMDELIKQKIKFDTIFADPPYFLSNDGITCHSGRMGDHHVNEIRKREKIFNLKSKKLELIGYSKLDNMISKLNNIKKLKKNSKHSLRILIAPSWGKSAISIKNLKKIIDYLLINNFFIILRLHPMTLKENEDIKNIFNSNFFSNNNFYFDDNTDSVDSFLESDILISDWSGSAIEFAFTKLRPVIFIDGKPKTNNPNWRQLNLPCFEDKIRNEIGHIISINELDKLSNLIKNIFDNLSSWEDKILMIRKNSVFNLGFSSKCGAKVIDNHLKKKY